MDIQKTKQKEQILQLVNDLNMNSTKTNAYLNSLKTGNENIAYNKPIDNLDQLSLNISKYNGFYNIKEDNSTTLINNIKIQPEKIYH